MAGALCAASASWAWAGRLGGRCIFGAAAAAGGWRGWACAFAAGFAPAAATTVGVAAAGGQGSGLCGGFVFAALGGGHAYQVHQVADVAFVQLCPLPTAQAAWQVHDAVAHANQAAHSTAYGLEHAAHFAVTPFGDGDAVPAVGAFAAAFFNAVELRHTVFEFDAAG